jgi:hypothetical protein
MTSFRDVLVTQTRLSRTSRARQYRRDRISEKPGEQYPGSLPVACAVTTYVFIGLVTHECITECLQPPFFAAAFLYSPTPPLCSQCIFQTTQPTPRVSSIFPRTEHRPGCTCHQQVHGGWGAGGYRARECADRCQDERAIAIVFMACGNPGEVCVLPTGRSW